MGFILTFNGVLSIKAIDKKDFSLEKSYHDLGYKSVEDAIYETENYFKRKLPIPGKLPPLYFTHSFGRSHKVDGDPNNGLEIVYLNVEQHFNYIINVRPAKYGMKYNSDIDTKVRLKDGTQAYYHTFAKGRVVVFTFEKEGWIYTLSLEKKLVKNAIATLTEIANSEPKKEELELDPYHPMGVRGLVPIDVSVLQFENHLHQDVMLPQYIPFLPTHSGSFYNKTAKIIQIGYLNQKTNERFDMFVYFNPEQKVREGKNAKLIKLDNGLRVVYNHIKESHKDSMRFKKGDLLYYLTITKNNREEKLGELIKIANSLK